ncbi:hypothetical protein ES703_25275 [subsurface metagenome]
MDNESFENIQWSDWCLLGDEEAKKGVPHKPGVYEIRTNFEFGRLTTECFQMTHYP